MCIAIYWLALALLAVVLMTAVLTPFTLEIVASHVNHCAIRAD